MRSKTKPTPGEIERANELVAEFCIDSPCRFSNGCGCVEVVSKALSEAREQERERCAKWHDKESAALRNEAEKLLAEWGGAGVYALRCLADAHESSAAAIRRGEP